MPCSVRRRSPMDVGLRRIAEHNTTVTRKGRKNLQIADERKTR